MAVFSIGYIGTGQYNYSEHKDAYLKWQRMFVRCYDEKYQDRHPTYIGCSVAEEWHNFQNFAKWYDDNFYQIEGENMHLDKDILVKGNKVYSSETCIFVPKPINTLFIKSATNKNELPTGVWFSSEKKRYIAQCDNKINKSRYIGAFKTPEEAYHAYKFFKQNYIKQVAEDYKDKIPEKLYDAMLNYQI
jgi:hypothetical protein